MNNMTKKIPQKSRKKLTSITAVIAEATQVELGTIIQMCRRQLAINNADAELISNFTGDLDLSDEAPGASTAAS